MVSDNWRPQVDAYGWQQALEKRLMNEERRPIISSASDLLGPGAAPFAVETNDWNDEACTFVGVFYSFPNEVRNSPDDTKGWIGETFGVEDGSGFQRLTIYDPVGPSPGFEEYERRFVTATGTVLYSAWERTDIGAVILPEVEDTGPMSPGNGAYGGILRAIRQGIIITLFGSVTRPSGNNAGAHNIGIVLPASMHPPQALWTAVAPLWSSPNNHYQFNVQTDGNVRIRETTASGNEDMVVTLVWAV